MPAKTFRRLKRPGGDAGMSKRSPASLEKRGHAFFHLERRHTHYVDLLRHLARVSQATPAELSI
jgi:hypothetical protein